MAFRNRADAVAAVAMPFPAGGGQTVPERDHAAVWIYDLKQQIAGPDAAAETYPPAGFLQPGGGVQRVFQAVG